MIKKVVTPSGTITLGQIGKIQEVLGAGLRKSGLPSEAVQQVLEIQGEALTAELVSVIRRRVEAASKMFSRRVRINRNLTPGQVIDSTGRVRGYVDTDVLATMPGVGSGPEEVEVWFFELDYDPTPGELEKEYELRDKLVPDGVALAQAVADDPALADQRPVACQWGLAAAEGAASCAVFDRWNGKRKVYVNRDVGRWGRYCRFAGVRK